jgi:hypothetical protein
MTLHLPTPEKILNPHPSRVWTAPQINGNICDRTLFSCQLFNETGLYYSTDKQPFNDSKEQTRERKMLAVSIVARIKCALVLIIFMLIPILPITGTIGLFILIFRPIWFKKLVDNVYADKNDRQVGDSSPSGETK